MTKTGFFDVTPHPRILQVLGEIEFSPSQCIAELIDNSIDSFVKMQRTGKPVADPLVQVAVGQDTVVVKDNGPGMSRDELERAVKAGWSSNDKFGTLGLYGIGFNIATARLGRETTIWTTRAGEKIWHGVTIDLPKLAQGGTYQLKVLTRAKAQSQVCGTEVEVQRLKPDWKDQLNNATWLRKNVTERLARIYGTMLRENNAQPIHFALRVNDKSVAAWEHCIWSEDRTVFRKGDGLVHAVHSIDQTFGMKFLSKSTGELYDSRDGLDDADLVPVPERVYGWIGVQRYLSDTEYGFDILRNGRKIEIGCKDLFQWESPDGGVIPEYPIDEQRHRRGRLVGELHLDHGYVHYTKHRFEREHSSWKQLLLAVKGNQPLVNREKLGFSGPNPSPLGALYRAFRRNSPGTGQDYKGILIIKDNTLATKWAAEFRKGNILYQSDQRWYEQVEKSDQQIPVPTDGDPSRPPTTGPQPSDPLDPGIIPGSTPAPPSGGPPAPQPKREPLPELNMHVTSIGPSGRAYPVEVFSVEPTQSGQALAPWRSRSTARGVYEVDVYREHEAFNSTSLQILDAVLAEVAHIIATEEGSATGDASIRYSDILVTLRSRYSTSDSLDPNALKLDIEGVRRQIANRLEANLAAKDQKALFKLLPTDDVKEIELARARGPKGASKLRYLNAHHIALVLEKQPALIFEAGCFTQPWSPDTLSGTPLLDEYRYRLANDVWLPMKELGEFARSGPADLTRTRLALARACVNRVKDFLAS